MSDLAEADIEQWINRDPDQAQSDRVGRRGHHTRTPPNHLPLCREQAKAVATGWDHRKCRAVWCRLMCASASISLRVGYIRLPPWQPVGLHPQIPSDSRHRSNLGKPY